MNAELRSETDPYPPGQDPFRLSPREWTRVGTMALFILGPKVLGWKMLDAGSWVCRLLTS